MQTMQSTKHPHPPVCAFPASSSGSVGPSFVTVELVDPIVVLAIRHAAATSLWDAQAISQPLRALPRALTPLATKAALLQLPHVDLDTASKVGDVDLLRRMLRWSNEHHGRPVNYCGIMEPILGAGHVDVLDWWVDESGLLLHWHDRTLALVAAQGTLSVLDWWKNRGFPNWRKEMVEHAVLWAARGGQVAVLHWLREHVPPDVTVGLFDKCCQFYGHVGEGQVAVLDFWWDAVAHLGVEPSQLVALVFNAFQHKQIACLEWCKGKMYTGVLDHYRHTVLGHLPNSLNTHSFLVLAVRGDLFEWIDTLHIPSVEAEYPIATQAACITGSLRALQWLHQKGYLRGFRPHMIQWACTTKEVSLAVLDWIQENVHCEPTTCAISPPEQSARVDVLEWLLQNGYTMSNSALLDLCANVDRIDLQQQRVPVLDWIASHAHSTVEDWIRLAFHRYSGPLRGATLRNDVGVLAWWLQQLKATGALESAVSEYKTNKLASPFEEDMGWGPDVLDWWLNHSGPLKDCFDFGQPCIWACRRLPASDPNAIRIVQIWLDAQLPLNFAGCINATSMRGNQVLLDWFLHTARAPRSDFVRAFTGPEFSYTPTWDGCDVGDHRNSLWWWKCNMPELDGMTSNRGDYNNPIHLHLLKHLLRVHCDAQDVSGASGDGNIALLIYLKQEHDTFGTPFHPQGLHADAGPLIAASIDDRVHVLAWWKAYSGMEITQCPDDIVEGKERIGKMARKWWLESGLCAHIENDC